MKNSDFIRIECMNNVNFVRGLHNGTHCYGIEKSKYRFFGTNIRLDTILRVDDLGQYCVFDNDGNYVKIIDAARIFTSCVVGRGINGVDTELWITKESYKRIVEALKLK